MNLFLINNVLKIKYLGFIFFNDREANRGDMECFLVKVDVFMEWKYQPTGIVEFLRLSSRKVWSGYKSQWNKPLEINQKKESIVGFMQGA